jgi:putative oxygen-independent coproporphyrinogen III oxidase
MTLGGTLGEPPSLAVYVHWPYCARICPYCDFNVVRDRGQAEQAALAQAIVADLGAQAALIGPRRLVSIFFGGGTPSLMRPEWVAAIVLEARRLWPVEGLLEITLEANPTDAEAGRFAGFAAAGVNRLSLGVQALDDPALKFLGRNHDAAEARRALDLACAAFPRLSIDLIYALPDQSPADWAAALRHAIDLGAEHISPYQLTIEPGTPFDRAVNRGRFAPPDPDTSASLYETTQAVLSAAWFDAYEVSNHARGPGARSRHNLAYWRGEDYLGVGPGAHGRLTTGEGRIATQTERGTRAYIARVREAGLGFASRDTLTPREAAIERLLLGLRIDEGVAWDELAALSLDPAAAVIAHLTGEGLVEARARRLIATRKGRAVLDSLVSALIREP